MKLYTNLKSYFINKNFLLYITSQAISTIGSVVHGVALLWIIYEVTGSAIIMGLSFALQTLPYLILLPFMGTIVDIYNRKSLILFSEIISGVNASLLFLFTILGELKLWHILFYMILSSAIFSVKASTREAITKDLVNKDEYRRANSIRSFLLNGIYISMPVVGAYLVTLGEVALCFLINAISFFIAALLFSKMEYSYQRDKDITKENFFENFKKGIRYLGKHYSLLYFMIVFSFINFFIAADMMLIRILISEYGFKANFLGYYEAIQAIGAMVLSFLFSLPIIEKRTTNINEGVFIIIGTFSLAGGILLLALLKDFYLLLLAPFIISSSIAVSNIHFHSRMQKWIPSKLYGRVISVLFLISECIQPLGYIFFGVLSDKIHISQTFLIISIGIAILGVIQLSLERVISFKKQYSN